MNSFMQFFKTIAMFFTATQHVISAVDHCAQMLDETAATAHKELTLNNNERISKLDSRLAAAKAKRDAK